MGTFYCTVLFHSCVTIFSRSSICYVPVVLGLLDHLIHDGVKALILIHDSRTEIMELLGIDMKIIQS